MVTRLLLRAWHWLRGRHEPRRVPLGYRCDCGAVAATEGDLIGSGGWVRPRASRWTA